MNGRTLTIGGLSATAAPLLIWAYQAGVITAAGIRYGLLIVGLAMMSLVISWGVTEAYKRLLVGEAWSSTAGRRKIYAAALLTGSTSMLLSGVVFLVLVEFNWRTASVIGVMWLLASVCVGVCSPWLWRLAFERILPRLYQFMSGNGPAG
jgi:hypothetical protein